MKSTSSIKQTDQNKCCSCGDESTVGINIMPYYDYIVGCVDGKFRYLHHFCDIHFLHSYKDFYSITTVGWKISYNSSTNEEVCNIVGASILTAHNYTGQSVRDSMVRNASGNDINIIRNAWSDNIPSSTKYWKRKGGKAK